MFPDGDVYDAPGADLLPDPVDLWGLPADIETFTFYIALPILGPHGGNADRDGYVRCEGAALDLFSEALPIEVPCLRKQPRRVPSAVPIWSDTYYFSVSTKNVLYERAMKAGALIVLALDGLPGLKIALLALT